MTDDHIDIAVEDLRALFDIATASLDFGSGFLDDAEVATLRRIALILGVDPMVATPANFARKFSHRFDAGEYAPGGCRFCGSEEHAVWHVR